MTDPHPSAPEAGAEADTPRSGRAYRSWIMLVLVLGAAGVALLVMDRAGPPALTGVVPVPRGEPDFSMEGAVVTQYRQDGTQEYRLTSDTVRHFEPDALTELSRPRFTLFDADGPPWEVSALLGTLRRPPVGADEETLSLRDDVVLEQTRHNGEQLRLTTSSLTVYPRRQYAETDQDVIIDSPVGRTRATGLEGDLQLGMLTFHSSDDTRVQTVLEPDQFK